MQWRELLMVVRSEEEIEPLASFASQVLDTDRGHVTCLTMIAEPIIPAAVGIELPAGFLAEQLEQAKERTIALQDRAIELLKRHGLSASSEVRTAPINYQERVLALAGRHADLIVMGQRRDDEDGPIVSRLIEAAFMSTGRPAVIIPYVQKEAQPIKRPVVAWDGSREASRALHDALPFLVAADKVQLVVIDGESLGDQIGEEPGADIGRHLAHHDVKVEVVSISSGGLRVGDVLLSHLADSGADLLVMGGYGHARLREVILGGATRSILDHMTVPVFLAH